MPLLQIYTNVARSALPKDIELTLSNEFQKMMGKPMAYIAVHVIPDQILAFGGDNKEPCAIIHLMSLGGLGTSENKALSATITNLLQTHMKVAGNRLYINFQDADRAFLGHNGTTFG